MEFVLNGQGLGSKERSGEFAGAVLNESEAAIHIFKVTFDSYVPENPDVLETLSRVTDVMCPKGFDENIMIGQKFFYHIYDIGPGALNSSKEVPKAMMLGVFEHVFGLLPVVCGGRKLDLSGVVREIGSLASIYL